MTVHDGTQISLTSKTSYAVKKESQALALTTNRESRTPPPPCPNTARRSSASPPVQQHHSHTPPSAAYPGQHSDEGKAPGTTVPVRCVVESVASLEQWKSRRKVLEADRYVIIPVTTTVQDLVEVALHRMGFPLESATAARGLILIKNWKPLTFDKVADSPLAAVGEILGELTTIATLKIEILKFRSDVANDIKDKLLRLLLVQSHPLLISSGCPLDEATLSQLVKVNSSGASNTFEPHEDVRRKFEQWWAVQVSHQMPARQRLHWSSSPPGDPECMSSGVNRIPEDRGVHPALQTVQNQYPSQKTRMRTSFDPELELPRLQKWFSENPHPSRPQIQGYVKELNDLSSRRERKLLDVNNVVYWFKNARAAQKRQEARSSTQGGHCQLSLNGYHSSSQSPSSPMYMRSPHEEEEEEEEDDEDHRGGSPSVPLSLITTLRRSPSTSPHHIEEVKQEPSDQELKSSSHSPNISTVNNNNCIKENLNNDISNEGYEDMDESEGDDTASKPGQNHAPEEGHRSQQFHNLESPDVSLLARAPPGFHIGHHTAAPPWFSQSIMYMSHYMPNIALGHNPAPNVPAINLALAEERRKRNRTFIDPVSEVPRLENWFRENTHPPQGVILKYTDDLNRMPYRQKFPKLEPKNVQFWFKNRRAKCKRLKTSMFDSPESGLSSQQQQSYHRQLAAALSGGDSYPSRE